MIGLLLYSNDVRPDLTSNGVIRRFIYQRLGPLYLQIVGFTYGFSTEVFFMLFPLPFLPFKSLNPFIV